MNPMTRIPLPSGYRWVADGDRIAHLLRARGRPVVARCGIRAFDERWAHPLERYCPACLAVAEAEVAMKRR